MTGRALYSLHSQPTSRQGPLWVCCTGMCCQVYHHVLLAVAQESQRRSFSGDRQPLLTWLLCIPCHCETLQTFLHVCPAGLSSCSHSTSKTVIAVCGAKSGPAAMLRVNIQTLGQSTNIGSIYKHWAFNTFQTAPGALGSQLVACRANGASQSSRLERFIWIICGFTITILNQI